LHVSRWLGSFDCGRIIDPRTAISQFRGVGEIGITGAAAAVANAVFNTTGKRIRDLPITLDKLLWAGAAQPHPPSTDRATRRTPASRHRAGVGPVDRPPSQRPASTPLCADPPWHDHVAGHGG
jgi:hypothetical protein